MEFLKKLSLAIIVFLMFSTISYSQNQEEIIDAFSQSYTYENLGEYNKAIEVLQNVNNADFYEANLRLGWLHYQAGLFTESKAYYQKASTILKYSIEAKYGLIYPLVALGNWEQVIETYKKILELDPNSTVANYKLGSIYYGRGEYKDAYGYFEKVFNAFPFDYDGLIMFAWCNYFLGNPREAKVLFNKVLMLSPTDSSAMEGLKLLE